MNRTRHLLFFSRSLAVASPQPSQLRPSRLLQATERKGAAISSAVHNISGGQRPLASAWQYRCFASNNNEGSGVTVTKSSPFAIDPNKKKKKRRSFTPPKAAVKLTPKARQFFKLLLENPPRPDVIGVMLNYGQASSGQPRMVFSFDFVSKDQIAENDEGVSLEVLEDGKPKPPKDAMNDGLPKLYVNHNGFMKVLGCTLDVDVDNMIPILHDPSGNALDPNV